MVPRYTIELMNDSMTCRFLDCGTVRIPPRAYKLLTERTRTVPGLPALHRWVLDAYQSFQFKLQGFLACFEQDDVFLFSVSLNQ